jgi:hypothetical protein
MHQYATICIQSYIIGIMRMVVGFVDDVRRSVGWWESMVRENERQIISLCSSSIQECRTSYYLTDS